MLASTIQFSNTPRNPTPTPDTTPNPTHGPPGTKPGDPREGQRYACGRGPATEETTSPRSTHQPVGDEGPGLLPQDPTVRHPHPTTNREPRHTTGAHTTRQERDVYDVSTHEHTPGGADGRARVFLNPDHTPHYRAGGIGRLLRKEVIQPHLPVRLPCYDFVPIASPTFDHSLPCGLGHGLRVLPTFVT